MPVSATAVIATIKYVMELAAEAVKLGGNVAPYAKAIYDILAGKEVTQEDLDKLTAEADAQYEAFMKPSPEEEADK